MIFDLLPIRQKKEWYYAKRQQFFLESADYHTIGAFFHSIIGL